MLAVSKGKQHAVLLIEDDSNYEGLHSEEEEEEEEGGMPAQHFQHIQCNKELSKRKANKAKMAEALAHCTQNDFSGCIPDGLRVKVWGPLNVEQLNSCFCRALGSCVYYSYLTNTVFVSTDTNCVAAYKFSTGQAAKILCTMVCKFAR
ncbi:hypothetical protein C0992_002753 [Termitomyces sp. T32_za158]|nr:hypothetical protein C0992_002753 [Termitomyces sp. T32_za158]